MRPYILFVCGTALAIPVQVRRDIVGEASAMLEPVPSSKIDSRDATTVTGLLEGIFESMTDADGHVLVSDVRRDVSQRRDAMPDSFECDFPVTVEQVQQCEANPNYTGAKRDAMPADSVEDAVRQAAESLVQNLDGNGSQS